MQCPTLAELPPALSNRGGWPWTEESTIHNETNCHTQLPKISIVTPSFNQAVYLEETIRSVLLQGYPDLEYIVVDGGSTDNSVEIIKKYEKWLTHWESGPDAGQADALNKGFSLATGELFAYINSDDFYEQGAFAAVAEAYVRSGSPGLMAGICEVFNQAGETRMFKPWWPKHLSHLLKPFGTPIPQPACFWRKDVHHRVKGFNESLHYAFDQEFFLKLGLSGVSPQLLDRVVARYRDHQKTKSQDRIKFYEDAVSIIIEYGHKCGLPEREIQKLILCAQNDMAYLRSFAIWKHQGRKAALSYFMRWAGKNPRFMLNRKVLGLARRLLFYRSADVPRL